MQRPKYKASRIQLLRSPPCSLLSANCVITVVLTPVTRFLVLRFSTTCATIDLVFARLLLPRRSHPVYICWYLCMCTPLSARGASRLS
jgi:hypothetical protein